MKHSHFWKIIFPFLIIFVSGYLIAGAPKEDWSLMNIPDSLKVNAHAIVRDFSMNYTVRDMNRQSLKVREVITVLDRKGDSHASFSIFYDHFQKLRSLRISIYNAFGQLIHQVKDSEIMDNSAVPDGSLYADTRMKTYQPLQTSYPFTIRYEYEIDYESLFYTPSWIPLDGFNLSLQNADFEMTFPAGVRIRSRARNFSGAPDSTCKEDICRLHWHLEGLKALDDEPYRPPFLVEKPMVVVSPDQFTYQDYAGTMRTWKEFGLWVYQLNDGRQNLSPETTNRIQNLVAEAKDTVEMVKLIYRYMQSHTRYVSIQVGIGGWQPIPAAEVDKTGYGDCKALSNYMISLLRVVGIPSDYVLVRAGSQVPQTDPLFPSRDFNHAIVRVPLQHDTIWLECTSQIQPFGFLGDFTDDRYVLAINSTGGEIVKTPRYNYLQNMISHTGEIKIDEEGNGIANLTCSAQGVASENLIGISYLGKKEQEDMLYDCFKMANMKIVKSEISVHPSLIPTGMAAISMSLERYATLSGTRIFVPLSIGAGFPSLPGKLKERKSDVEIRRDAAITDTIMFIVPENWKLEFLPGKNDITSPFGKYRSEIGFEGHRLTCIRQFVLYRGRTRPEGYSELTDFLKAVSKAENEQCVFLK